MKKLLLITVVLTVCVACFSSCALINKIFPCKHKETVTDNAIAPTCTESGLTEGSHCAKCGEKVVPQESVSPLGHAPVIDDEIKATCTENGLTAGAHCSVCNATTIVQEIIPAAHTYGEWEIVSESDCFFEGVEKRICSVCGEKDTKNNPTIGHSFEVNENSGLHTCTLCKAVIYRGHLYAVVDNKLTWYDAYAACESIGGHLVTITSADEQEIINDFMNSYERDIYWTGGYKNVSGWEWVTGEKVSFTNWRSSMPDNHGKNEFYINVYGYNAGYVPGSWNDLDAIMKNHPTLDSAGYICEWELEITEDSHNYSEWIVTTEASCFNDGKEMRYCKHCGVEETRVINQIEHNFVLNKETGISSCEYCEAVIENGHIYLIFNFGRSWFDAYAYCKSVGGELVSITSEEEQLFIEKYMTAKGHTVYTWIGAYTTAKGAPWRWTSGEEFSYSKWLEGEPNHSDSNEYFGLINYGNFGNWNDYQPLNYSLPFICEWS